MNPVRGTYTTALRFATPALLGHLARRSRRQAGVRDDWRARLGFVAPDVRNPVWIHAASAGEMQAALPLAEALAEDYPLRLTAFSASGLARAAVQLPEIPATLAPLDLPGAWRRFLARTAPRLLILVETELWPNLLAAATARRLPAVLASARLTPAAARRLARFPGTSRALLEGLAGLFAQTEADLERFRMLGLPAGHGQATGNLKEAQLISEAVRMRGRALRAGPLAGRRVWVAGSVREGEEAFIAEAADRIRERVPEGVALVAPRHPERAPLFAAALAERGIETLGADVLDAEPPVAGGAAVVVDRLGVLLDLYAASDVAFVGGTFAPLGGHNVLEPALCGRPILAGPNLDNVRGSADRLVAAGGLSVVADAPALAEKVIELLNDPAAARGAGDAARRAASRSESLGKTRAALAPFLDSVKPVATAPAKSGG